MKSAHPQTLPLPCSTIGGFQGSCLPGLICTDFLPGPSEPLATPPTTTDTSCSNIKGTPELPVGLSRQDAEVFAPGGKIGVYVQADCGSPADAQNAKKDAQRSFLSWTPRKPFRVPLLWKALLA